MLFGGEGERGGAREDMLDGSEIMCEWATISRCAKEQRTEGEVICENLREGVPFRGGTHGAGD